ncbi:hypothetical protein [Tistrella mobilis]|uniref:hypothetical protein n=1 Tax=Tistrella mobilis TaxID=171437 RepID=UPI003557140D
MTVIATPPADITHWTAMRPLYRPIIDGRSIYLWLLLVEPARVAASSDRSATGGRHRLCHPRNRLAALSGRDVPGQAEGPALLGTGCSPDLQRAVAEAVASLRQAGFGHHIELAMGAIDTTPGDGRHDPPELARLQAASAIDVDPVRVAEVAAGCWARAIMAAEDGRSIPAGEAASAEAAALVACFAAAAAVEAAYRLRPDPASGAAASAERAAVSLPAPSDLADLLHRLRDSLPLLCEATACLYPHWGGHVFMFDTVFDHAKALPLSPDLKQAASAAVSRGIGRALAGTHMP